MLPWGLDTCESVFIQSSPWVGLEDCVVISQRHGVMTSWHTHKLCFPDMAARKKSRSTHAGTKRETVNINSVEYVIRSWNEQLCDLVVRLLHILCDLIDKARGD